MITKIKDILFILLAAILLMAAGANPRVVGIGGFDHNDTFVPVKVGEKTRGLLNISYGEHRIHLGDHFFVSGFETESNAGTIDISITTPASPIRMHMEFTANGTTQTEFRLYEGADVAADGDAVTPYNNNRNSATVSGTTIQKDPTVNSTGTLILSSSKGEEVSAAAASDFAAVEESEKKIILEASQTYLFRITSRGDGNIISYYGFWCECAPEN